MNNLTHSAIIKDKLANFGHKIIHKIDHAVQLLFPFRFYFDTSILRLDTVPKESVAII